MAFLVSPAVRIVETDLSSIIPNVQGNNAAIVGQFQWGPAEEIQFIDNEDSLVTTFAKPSLTVYKDFLCSSSFLSYATNLQVVRVVKSDALNSTGSASAGTSGQLIKNEAAYNLTSFTSSTDLFVAKYPGALGNIGEKTKLLILS